jgi:hypothetical protein
MCAADVFVLGYCEDTRILLDLLMLEAPGMLARLVVVEPDAATARELDARGVRVHHASLSDPLALGGMIAGARLVVCFDPARGGWTPDVLRVLLRSLVPMATLYVHGATRGRPDDAHGMRVRSTPAGLGARLTSWRLWVLVAVAAVDAAIFFLPVTATALLVAALLAPRRLQQAASFLDALATGRGT